MINSTIGVKQGDLAGPDLFNIHIAAVMMIWRQRYTGLDCVFRTKKDHALGTGTKGHKRDWKTGGKYGKTQGVETFKLNDSEYADDTQVNFTERLQLQSWSPDLVDTFEDCGMDVHLKKPRDKKAKTVALYVAAQSSEYDRFHSDEGGAATYGGADLTDIKVDDRGVIPVVEKARYLGGMLNRNANHEAAVDDRIAKASSAFGKLKPRLFKSDDISLPAKRAAYVALVLSILLYGSECWAITARMRRKLRSFHRFCCRTMFGIKNMHQVKDQKTTTAEVLEECGLRSLDTYMARRRLRWLGHVWRMDWDRLPRKLLSSWVYQARPLGRPCKRWGESIEDDLKLAGLKVSNWHETAEDRDKWREIIDKLGDPKKRKPKKSHKNAKKSGK